MSLASELEEDTEPLEPNDFTDETVLPPEVLVEVRRIIRSLRAWSGPLPPADELAEYRDVRPGTEDIIVADFQRRSEIESTAIEHEQQLQLREFQLQEREQAIRDRESTADIEIRRTVVGFGQRFLPMLVIAAFLILLTGSFDSDPWRVAAASIFMAPITLLAAIVLLRGRMTESERDIYHSALRNTTTRRGVRQENSGPGGDEDELPSLSPKHSDKM